MDKFTECYLNTIVNNKNKFKSKRKIISESDVVYQNIQGNNATLVFDPRNLSNTRLEGGTDVKVMQKGKEVSGQITDDPELIKGLGLHRQQADQLSPEQIKALQEGVGSDTWSSLKQGGAFICNGTAYLIEGPAKILSWPFKALGNLISPETKRYTINPDYQRKAAAALQKNGKAASQQQVNSLQAKDPAFYKALQEAPEGYMLWDRATGRLYRKFQGKFYVVPWRPPGMAGGTMQQNKQAINQATKYAQANGIQGGAGTGAFMSVDGRYVMGNPQLKNMFIAGCKKLQLKDKKSKGDFLQMISRMFMSMFGLHPEDEFEEYTDTQRMSFSPFIKKIVGKGILPPGTYKFEYKQG